MDQELRLSVKPDWAQMVEVNERAFEFLQSLNLPVEVVDTFLMVICELVENGIKYGDTHYTEQPNVDLFVTMSKQAITVHVRNRIGNGSTFHLRQLDRTLQWIRGFQDPFQAYIERVKEISREAATHGRSGLGIVRIAYEARAAIDFVVGEDDTLSVSAVAKITQERSEASDGKI